MPIKVLHLVKTSLGAAWALSQMRELRKLGLEVHVALPYDGPLVPAYQEAGIVVHEINYSLTHLLRTGKRLREIVNLVQPDIIHSHFVLTTLIMRLMLRSSDIPRVFQVPGPLHLEHAFFRNVEMLPAQKNDYWMGSCRWTNTRYEKSGISRNRLFLAFYGTEREKLPSPGTQQRIGILRKELKLTSDDILVGMVAYMYAPKRFLGQRHGLKGHEDFIDAIAMLREDNPKIHGVCVGGAYNEKSKWYEEQVRKYAHKKCPDGMFFTGTRSDVFDIYPDFDLAVHPSHSENLGGAIQSLLMGIPTIASEVGGFPDIVIPGETGLLIPPKNPNAIAEAIKEGLDNIEKMRKMALNGQTMICEGFTADVTTLAVLEAYKVILRK